MKSPAPGVLAVEQEPPSHAPASVDEVRVLPRKGPWPSKSGGQVHLPFALPHAQTARFFQYDPVELGRVPVDIRGLRIFTLRDMPLGGVACREFHRLRTEVIFTTSGKVRWTFEDVYGGEKEISPALGCALFMPPFILHTIAAEDEGSSLLVLANTLFMAEDPRTHDSYPEESFRQLQRRYRTDLFSAHQSAENA